MFNDDDDMPSLSRMSQRMARVHRNGDMEGGKGLQVREEWNMDDLLNAAQQRLRLTCTPTRIFNSDGMEITDVMMMEDNAIVFVSQGADFIPPTVDGEGADEHDLEASGLPPIVGGYKVLDFLGKGGFGEVRVGEHQLTGEKVALKFLRKSEIADMGAAERTTTEIQCLTALKHPAIIRLVQHVNSPQYVVLVFELMEGGDMYHYLADLPEQRLDEDEARFIFHNVVSAVGYAHNQHICHRDLKLDNILLKQKKRLNEGVKIADFGLSDFYRPGATSRTNCGTLSYLAPEVFHGTSNAGPPLDVWAMGVILYALLCGRLPFEGTDFRSKERTKEAVIRQRILQCQYKVDDTLNVSPEAKDLVRRMLKLDPNERASIPEVFNHCWLRARNQPSLDLHLQTSSSMTSSSSSPPANMGPTSLSAEAKLGSPTSSSPPLSSSPSRPHSPRRLLRPLERKGTSDESRDGPFEKVDRGTDGKGVMRRGFTGLAEAKDSKEEGMMNGNGNGRPLSAVRRRGERKDSKNDGDSDGSENGGGYSDGSKEAETDRDGFTESNGNSSNNNSNNSDDDGAGVIDDDGDEDESSYGGGEGRDFQKSYGSKPASPSSLSSPLHSGHVKSSRSVGCRSQGSSRTLLGMSAGMGAASADSTSNGHGNPGSRGGGGHNRLHLSATLPSSLNSATNSNGLEPIVSPRSKGGGGGGGSRTAGGNSSSINSTSGNRPMSRGGGLRELEPISPRGSGPTSPSLSSPSPKHHHSATGPSGTMGGVGGIGAIASVGLDKIERAGRTGSDSDAQRQATQPPSRSDLKLMQQSSTSNGFSKTGGGGGGGGGLFGSAGNNNGGSSSIPSIHTSSSPSRDRDRESVGGPGSLSPSASFSSTLPSLSPRSPPRKYK